MTTMIDAYISVAEGYIGAETGSGRQRRIVEFYNQISPLPRGYRLKYTDAWCAAFVSAVGYMLDLTPAVIRPECGAHEMFTGYAASQRRRGGSGCQRGDLLFYDWNSDGRIDHVGIVTFATDETLQVLEGNKDGSCGYRYIKSSEPAIYGSVTPAWESGSSVKKYVDTDSLNLREAPSMEAKILDVMIYGAEVEVLDEVEGWAAIRYYEAEGYAGASYLSEEKPPATGKILTALYLREGPGTDKRAIMVLPSGTVFHYTGDREVVGSSVWERIFVDRGEDGTVGWINRRYAEPVS